jgi:hypothetical protein
LVAQHPEKEPEVAGLWIKYLESDVISVPEFCRVVEYLSALDPDGLRALRPCERVAKSPLARESIDRALCAVDAMR